MAFKTFPYVLPKAEQLAIGSKFPMDFEHRCRPPLHNQGLTKQCVADSLVQCAEFTALKMGLQWPQLSAAEVYSRSEPDESGTHLGTTADRITEGGIGLSSISGITFSMNIVPTPEEIRQKYRATWWAAPKNKLYFPFDYAYSAVIQGFPVAATIDWNQGFRTDNDGYLLKNTTSILYGHCIFAYSATVRKGKRVLICRNSSGIFSKKTKACVAISEEDLVTSGYLICQTVTYDRENSQAS